ncbi:MAG: outer membrane protein assembly factor BamB [Pseudomonadales bacterium]|nr:outer membrane protein assembly factor BamB [Pseudomonadales bacterium]
MRLLLLILASFAIVACSDDDDVLPPSPLPEFKPSIQVEKLWGYEIDNGIEDNFLLLRPAITENFVYAVSYDGEVAKLDRKEGDELWEIDTDQKITGGVDAGYGVVLYGTAEGEAVALNDEDGSQRWLTKLSGQVLAVPAVGPELVVFQTYDGRLHALTRDTGEVKWVYDTSVPALTLRGESSPVQLGNIVLAGFANGKLVALDSGTGFVGWERTISEPQGRSELERLNDLDGRFWLNRNTVFAVNFQGNLVALDIRTGQPRWTKEFSSFAGVSEFLDQVYVVDEDSNIYALDAVNGADVWQQELLKGRTLTAPTPYDRYAVVGDFEGYLHWLSYRDGSFLARVKVDGDGLWAPPIVKDDIVYVQGNSGEIAAYQVAADE